MTVIPQRPDELIPSVRPALLPLSAQLFFYFSSIEIIEMNYCILCI